MNLFDVLEMLIDWTAVTSRRADGVLPKVLKLIGRDLAFLLSLNKL
jgi:hypothetical protein